jgi:tRNA-binding EMAP/Myf-like protein
VALSKRYGPRPAPGLRRPRSLARSGSTVLGVEPADEPADLSGMPEGSKARPLITAGAVVGHVTQVDTHPNADVIYLATVDIGGGVTKQIVFGGTNKDLVGELVPVAPPGARVVVRLGTNTEREKRMRVRTYRGERSHGMLCSLEELGWHYGGPDEVAVLRKDLKPGQSLHDIPKRERWRYVERPLCLEEPRRWRLLRIISFRSVRQSRSSPIGG